jgi:SAM-dependent methyltransferase
MAKKTDHSAQIAATFSQKLPGSQLEDWQIQIAKVGDRYNREYRRAAFTLPPEIEAMPIFHDWAAGTLQAKIASPFWQLIKPQKNQHCLDIGCGLSFLIYPCWREWNVYFHGQEISSVAQEALNSRGSQLNSKLFKRVELSPAHQLRYEDNQFDWAIATGFSCYYPPDYWAAVLTEVKRILKPSGQFIFDVVDPSLPLAENWAILETYLGSEVFLEPLATWQRLIQAAGATISSTRSGELFQVYKISF